MEPRPVPQGSLSPNGHIIDVRPPPGIDMDECGTANMQVEPASFGEQVVDMFSAYFQPTKDDLEKLSNGGYIEFSMLGHVVPHSCRVVSNE